MKINIAASHWHTQAIIIQRKIVSLNVIYSKQCLFFNLEIEISWQKQHLKGYSLKYI